MFESAEIGHAISDRRYERDEPGLREALLDAQYDLLADKSFPVILIIGGVDGAGKGETVNILNEWTDPRNIVTHAFGEPSDEERERPRMWRYWRALPPKGSARSRICGEEQLERFREREKTPFKRFKITPEDWRNRRKWPQYERAVCDMIERTSNDDAPWVLVPANDEYYARIEVLKTLCERLEARL